MKLLDRLSLELEANIERFESNIRQLDNETFSEEVMTLQDTVTELEAKIAHLEKKLVLVTTENHRLRQRLAVDPDDASLLQAKYRKALVCIEQLRQNHRVN
jgi:predicted  nucleic acid-binding Zn-ribbon protein